MGNEKRSKYRGVTYQHGYIAQIRIAGKMYCLGRFREDERAAALRADNARICLQDFFPRPLDTKTLNFGYESIDQGIDLEVEQLRERLLAANVPQYVHSEDAPQTTEQTRVRLQNELKQYERDLKKLTEIMANTKKSLELLDKVQP